MIAAREYVAERDPLAPNNCQTVSRARFGVLLAAVLAAVFVGGCAIRFFPEHEPAIIDGLKDLNTQGLTFFESASWHFRRQTATGLLGLRAGVECGITID